MFRLRKSTGSEAMVANEASTIATSATRLTSEPFWLSHRIGSRAVREAE